MDGCDMNALVGKVRPGDFGVDVMPEPAQDFLNTARRQWTGSGPWPAKRSWPFLPQFSSEAGRPEGLPRCRKSGGHECRADGRQVPTAVSRSGSQAGRRARGRCGAAFAASIRRAAALELRPSTIGRPRCAYSTARQHRNVHSCAGLHSGQWSRRPAPDHGRRGAKRQLHP